MNPLNPLRRRRSGEHRRLIRMVPESPLRSVDARVKLAICVLVALSVMLPLERLALFWLVFAAGIVAACLAREMLYQIRRILFILVLLFVLDWVGVSFTFAILITLRFTLVVCAFTLFFATTTPEEFRLAMERLGMPYAYAFSLSLAFLSISLMHDELLNIVEAQRSRGAWQDLRGLRKVGDQVSGLVALGVPAVVLTVKRAWAYTEAAHTRGLDSPRRRPFRELKLSMSDGALLLATVGIALVIMLWQ